MKLFLAYIGVDYEGDSVAAILPSLFEAQLYLVERQTSKEWNENQNNCRIEEWEQVDGVFKRVASYYEEKERGDWQKF